MWQCELCGRMNDDKSAYCINCGMARPASVTQKKPAKRKKKRSALPFIIAGSVVLVIALAAGGVFLAVERRYRRASEFYAAGEYEEASDAYSGIKWYRDSDELAAEAQSAPVLEDAYQLLDRGDYEGARQMVVSAGCVGGKVDLLIEETYINEAREFMSVGDYESADAALENAGDSATANSLRNEVTWVLGDAAESEPSHEEEKASQSGTLELPSLGGGLASAEEEVPTGGLVFNIGGEQAADNNSDAGIIDEAPMTNISGNQAVYSEFGSVADDRRIAAGSNHTVAVRGNGTVMSAGKNDRGQCDVSIWRNIVEVSAGSVHTVGLKKDGTVLAVGDNEYGQCNTGSWTNIVSISAGGHYTVGLKSNGTVAATGVNMYGQCNVQDWRNVVAVSAGNWHTLGVTADGRVLAAGSNGYGQCDVSEWTGIVQASAGLSHSVALKSDGTVVAAGSNEYGQCDVAGWRDIVAVKAGAAYTVGLKADGTMVITGFDENSDLSEIGTWRDIAAISVGSYHTVGIKNDGSVIAAGWDIGDACNTGSWDIR